MRSNGLFFHLRTKASRRSPVGIDKSGMSIVALSRAVRFAAVFAALAAPAQSQSVVVRHLVATDVAPLVAARDTGWVVAGGASTDGHWIWSGEVRGNALTEVQLLVPRAADGETVARLGAGPWRRLEPGSWTRLADVPPGRRQMAIEVLIVSSGIDVPLMPAVRILSRLP